MSVDRVADGADIAPWVGTFLAPIFHMNEREAAGVFVEVGDGILDANRDPAEVHFRFYVFAVGLRKEIVEGQCVEAVDFFKLKRVIVVGELNASLPRGFTYATAGFREALVAVGSA